ncbi:MAG: SLBB domain-containing protein [Fusobacteriota bacterium]
MTKKKFKIIVICFFILSFFNLYGQDTASSIINSGVSGVNANDKNSLNTISSDLNQPKSEANIPQNKVEDIDLDQEKRIEELKNKDIENETIIQDGLYQKLDEESIFKTNDVNLYGKKIFDQSNTHLSLPTEVNVDENYILSSGDYLQINMSSDLLPEESSKKFTLKVSQTGSIFLGGLGTINVRGKTIKEVKDDLLQKSQKKYKDMKLDISLLKMRSTRVFIMGEVGSPGSYVLNPLSNILNAIYLAKGITKNSSLRNIKILRNDEIITIDLYNYLIKGNNNDIKILKDGDTIFVPILKNKVTLKGGIIRPGIYETKNEKSVLEVLELAGGLKVNSIKNHAQITRISDDSMKILDIDDLKKSQIKNGDIIRIGKIDDQYDNGVHIYGNVLYPGVYQLEEKQNFKEILDKAGGLKSETYLKRANILRKKDDTDFEKIEFSLENENPTLKKGDRIYIYSKKNIGKITYATIKGAIKDPGVYKVYKNTRISDLIFNAKGLKEEDVYTSRADLYRINRKKENSDNLEVIEIDLESILNEEKEDDLLIKDGDVLKIYKTEEVMDVSMLEIFGDVGSPGKYRYYNGMTLNDLIFYAKGLKRSSDKTKIEIARNDETGRSNDVIEVDFNSEPNYVLKEDDKVFVRTIPGWENTNIIEIKGYVKYPGKYSISKGETLNHIIQRAGGFRDKAFIPGIKFTRREKLDDNLSEIEKLKLLKTGEKSPEYIYSRINNITFNFNENKYNQEIILQDKDLIEIPKRSNFVRVKGEVYNPGLVILDSGSDLRDYIKAAGDFTEDAATSEVYVIKYNGRVDKPGFFRGVDVEYGDTIVIPTIKTRNRTWKNTLVDTLDTFIKVLTAYKLADSTF